MRAVAVAVAVAVAAWLGRKRVETTFTRWTGTWLGTPG